MLCVQGRGVEVCAVCTRDGSGGVCSVYKGWEWRCVLCAQGMGVVVCAVCTRDGSRGVYCVLHT